MVQERATIIRGKLVIMTEGGSVMGLGIRGFRSGLRQIENSKRELRDSTKARAEVYRAGIAMLEARK